MLQHALDLPARSARPREAGLTMMIDSGLSTPEFDDVIASFGEYVDYVKFGWGTALVSPNLEDKIATLQGRGIGFFFGGTLFEKHVQQGRFEDYVALCRCAGATTVEVSNGTLDMTNEEKGSWIRKLADTFTVVSEVGSKQTDSAHTFCPDEWAEYACQDLEAGASLVITEARESGTAGIADTSGAPRRDVVDAVLEALPARKVLFEAPNKSLQSYLIDRVGVDVNLGNIAPRDLVSLETLRLGLRSDTFFTYDHRMEAA